VGCNCKWTEIIIALVILIVTIWPNIVGATVSMWLVVIAAALLLIHALKCGCTGMCGPSTSGKATKKKKR